MIKHVVMWNIKDGLDRDLLQREIKEKLTSLLQSVPTLLSVEVGLNHNQSPAKRDICLYTTFNNKEDLDSYQVHPAHVAVKDYIVSVTTDAVVVDYQL